MGASPSPPEVHRDDIGNISSSARDANSRRAPDISSDRDGRSTGELDQCRTRCGIGWRDSGASRRTLTLPSIQGSAELCRGGKGGDAWRRTWQAARAGPAAADPIHPA